MATILLIRHGENDYVKKRLLAGRLPEVHLNAAGRAQAAALAEKLASAPLKAVYSSPLERTVETAGPIARALNLEVILRPGLMEVDFGEWSGQKLKNLSRTKEWKIVQAAPSRMTFPEGESFLQAQQRVVTELESLARLHAPEDLFACVSHSDVIKLALAYFIGLPLDMFQRLHISPASISILQLGETGSRLLAMNYDPSMSFAQPEKPRKKS
ncbi:MAG: histidine phosphatase family protein [Anaerolineales bacterium]|nr:histidine phosphatase family protein [Anaerolineales bacterium]